MYSHLHQELVEDLAVMLNQPREEFKEKLSTLTGTKFEDFVLSSWSLDYDNRTTLEFLDTNNRVWTFIGVFERWEMELPISRLQRRIQDRFFASLRKVG